MEKQASKKIYINARFLTQPITGVQRYAHELVKALDLLIGQGEIAKDEYDIQMLAPRKGVIHDLGLKYIPLRQVGSLKGHGWEQFELPGYTKDGLLFCPGNTAPVFSLLSKQKTIVTVHDLSYLYFPNAYSLPFRVFYNIDIPLVLSCGDAVITVSESEKNSILEHYPRVEERLYAIQNGGLPRNILDNLDKIEPLRESEPFVLYVGALSRRKNLQGVIKAFALLGEETNLRLVVVGAGGKTFNNAQFTVPSNIQLKVDFKGQINDTRELIRLYKTASCLVFPSFYEASPLPPIEAMACGCPVIASTIPSLQERCGDAALYCDPNDPADIAEKIKMLIYNPSLREKLRKKGLERAREFTWEKCARETFAVIEKILT